MHTIFGVFQIISSISKKIELATYALCESCSIEQKTSYHRFICESDWNGEERLHGVYSKLYADRVPGIGSWPYTHWMKLVEKYSISGTWYLKYTY